MANERVETMRELKAQLAHEMDVFVYDHVDIFIANEIDGVDLLDVWLRDGVPDGADEDYLYDLLECPGVWENICQCFGEICKAAGFIEE